MMVKCQKGDENAMIIIAIANQKGGTGKTPTTVNVGFALARKGCSVLLVDLDPQGSLSEYFLAEKAETQEPTIYDALVSMEPIQPLHIAHSGEPMSIDLLPAHDGLAAAEIELPNKPNAQKRLAKILGSYTYDFCLLDCPPSLGILTLNALAAAHQVIIPVKTELSAERTIKLITRTIEEVQKSDLNTHLKIWGILPTLYDVRKSHHKEMLQAIHHKHGEAVYGEPSKETTRYNDAITARLDVSAFDKELGRYWDRIAETFTTSADGRNGQ